MSTRLAIPLVALAILIAASPVAAQAGKQGKILMLGDSITKYGMPEAVAAPLNELTRGKVAWTLVNAGIGGETAEVGKTRLPALLETEKPDLLTVSYGLNDLARNCTADRFRASFLEIIDLAAKKSPATKVILLTATPFDIQRHGVGKNKALNDQGGADLVLELKFNSVVRQLAAEKNLPLIDLHRLFMTDPAWTRYIKPDGVHLTPEGYTFAAKHLALAIAAWHQAEVVRDPAIVKARDALVTRLKEVAAQAKGAQKPEVRKQLLNRLDDLWRACPYLPPQAALWHSIYYAGQPAAPVTPDTPKPAVPADSFKPKAAPPPPKP